MNCEQQLLQQDPTATKLFFAQGTLHIQSKQQKSHITISNNPLFKFFF